MSMSHDETAETPTEQTAEVLAEAASAPETEVIATAENTPATDADPQPSASADHADTASVGAEVAGEGSSDSTPQADVAAQAVATEPASDPEPVAASAETAAEAADTSSAVQEPTAAPPVPEPAPVLEPPPSEPSDVPYFVLTALLDASAKPAAITRSHGDALDRLLQAADGQSYANVDVVELPIAPRGFKILRQQFNMGAGEIGLYDVFPLAKHLSKNERTVAGQFLAAEIVWALEEQGVLSGIPLNLRLDVPTGWARDPKSIHERLLERGALNLSEGAFATFKDVKSSFDATREA